MARTRDAIEARFRAGSNWFFLVGALSALASTAAYKGWVVKPLWALSLGMPLVVDQLARLVPMRFGGDYLIYYSYCFGLILAGAFGVLGLLSKYGSHTGAFLNLGRVFGGFARLGSWLGLAHLVGSRLFYFAGIVLYLVDGTLGWAIEEILRSFQVTRLQVAIKWNLGFHGLVLALLIYGFLAGLERERRQKAEETQTLQS